MKKIDELFSPGDIIDEDDDELELIIDTEELKQNVKEIYVNLDELTLEDEDLGKRRIRNCWWRQRRLELIINDLLDELLADIPSDKRTERILNNIHISIEQLNN